MRLNGFNFIHDPANQGFFAGIRLHQRKLHAVAADTFEFESGFESHGNSVAAGLINFVDFLQRINFFLKMC